MHKLLARQLKQAFGSIEAAPREIRGLLGLVDDTYRRADEDRQTLESSLRLTSEELMESNRELRRERRALEHRVTSRTRALRVSEKKYRSLFEESHDVIFIAGADSRLLDINPAGVELFGFDSRQAMLGADLAHTIYRRPEDRSRFQQQVMAQGVVNNYELELQTVTGEELWVLATATAMRGPDGAPLGIRGILRDVTEQRALRDQLYQSQKMEAIGRLAGGVAHDFNNLLTAVIGYADLLAAQLAGAGQRTGHLEQIQIAADRGSNLVRQLLAFSRQQVLSPQIINLNHVVSDIEKLLGRVIGEDVQLSTDLDDSLGSVLADPSHLEQVILNLVVNSRDAMPEGGRLYLRTSNFECSANPPKGTSLQPGGYIVLEIEDTGTGIDEALVDQIFEPFFTTKRNGTGLGLATVYGVVKQSEGQIRVESASGRGTSFFVYLPRVNSQPETTHSKLKRTGIPGGSERILLVEDEPAVRDLLREFLTLQGYDVVAASDGLQGWQEFTERNGFFDLLLTDVVMPKMSGIELAEKMRQINPDLRVLLVSGYSEKQASLIDRVGSKARIDFLPKPFTLETMACKLREVLAPTSSSSEASEPTNPEGDPSAAEISAG
ncbi:MAG: ATP-binding protein [Acidobacteriota bacterium]